MKKVVIVGGVAGGATALARLRRVDEDCSITLFERGAYISFANCGLPYYVGNVIRQRTSLILQEPEALAKKFNAEIRIRHEVTAIDRKRKVVVVHDLEHDTSFEQPYDVLLLSTGSTPLKPPIPGIDLPRIRSLWTIPDADAIKKMLAETQARRVAIVGAGFIGLEMAENLRDLGLDVSIIEKAPQAMAPMDPEMAEMVHQELLRHGIDLKLNCGVVAFEQEAGGIVLHLDTHETTRADLVLLSIGVRPNSELAKAAGLALNQRGGIVVDQYLRTSDPSIYAIGDVIEIDDYVLQTKGMIPLAGPANKQGRIVAHNLVCEDQLAYRGTQGTSVAKIFDLTVAATGANEKVLNRNGNVYPDDYQLALIHVNAHAGYYPGALPMTLKLIFANDGKLLGAQGIGYEGVDKRIDVIASVIRLHGTVADLTDLELAYAPPYSSAKDPTNMIGFVAENILNKMTTQILWRDVDSLDSTQYQLLDVREKEEYFAGQIPNSLAIPLSELRERLDELNKDVTYVTYCAVGLRGYLADRILKQHGYKSANLAGGYTTWRLTHPQAQGHLQPTMAFHDSGHSVDIATATTEVIQLDACGLSCPGPIMKVSAKMKELKAGDVLEVMVTDPGFLNDIKAWCENTGNTLLDTEKNKDHWAIRLLCGQQQVSPQHPSVATTQPAKKQKTLVVFSGDLDKAIAAFIIANGARAMGDDVSMFFTFWGLSIIRKEEKQTVQKDMMSKMFAKMLPRGSKQLQLSQMDLAGMGPKMIRKVMKEKNITSLESLIQEAQASGIKMVACQMSMDVMGITKEELLDGVEVGGVATMLADASNSNGSFFI